MSDTRAAASKMAVQRSHLLRKEILNAIESQPEGLTCDEIEVLLGYSHQSASPRFGELALQGKIKDSGERRKTRQNCDAVVWTAVPRSDWESEALSFRTSAQQTERVKLILKLFREYVLDLSSDDQETLLKRVRQLNRESLDLEDIF